MTRIDTLPKISVVMPVKNSVKTIEKSIQSLITQNYPNLEFIVIDGASTDGSLEIIKKYENQIDYWQSKPDNSTIAYIEGIQKSTSDIIGFLNADDFYEPEILHQAAEEFAKNPELDIVSFRCRAIKRKGDGFEVIEESKLSDMVLSKEKVIEVPGVGARFFKKKLFTKNNFPTEKDERGRIFLSNDLEYILFFAISGTKNKVIDYIGYNYLSHEDSLTFSKDLQTKIRLCEDKIFIAKKFLASSMEISDFWKGIFKKWIKKYRASIVKFQLEKRNWKEATANATLGVNESGLFQFGFYLLKTLLRKKIKLHL